MVSHLPEPAQTLPQHSLDTLRIQIRKLMPNAVAHQAQRSLEQLNRGVDALSNRKGTRPPHLVGVDGVCQRLDVGFVHARTLKHTPPPSNSDFLSRATATIHGADERLELILPS